MAIIAASDKWGPPIERDLTGVEYLRKIRGVNAFEEMPLYVQRVYKKVARRFPGVQVWVVGSRVRGDYIEPGDADWVKDARADAGMKPKEESDFDFLVSPDAVQVGELPANTERVRCRIPESEKIPIPIYYPENVELGERS